MREVRLDIHNSDVPVLCRSCEARHNGICGALNNDELLRLSRHTTTKQVRAGAELVGEAETIETYANVLSGVVKLSKVMADGRQQIVGLQFAPDFVGRPFEEASKVSAEAASDVSICVFPRSSLEAMMKEQPGLEHRLLRQSLKELDEAREWMLTLGRKTAEEKVASFLHMIATHIDPTADLQRATRASFDLPLSRGEIADFLGLTIETVSRQMTKLRKSGVIEIEGSRHVTVPNVEALQALADG